MRRLGLHTSIAGGLHKAIERGHQLGCTCVQIFSHNPRGWALADISEEERGQFGRLCALYDISPVFIHTSYLLNIASQDSALRGKSIDMLREEMLRADALGAGYVVLHTGTAHDSLGIARAGESIREALGGLGARAGLLLENTSGKRGDIATRIADLAALMDASKGLPAGVCIDSCHAFAAGCDLRRPEEAERLGAGAIRLLGRGAVRLVHLNDSKGQPGTGLDRHEHLGRGAIGREGLVMFARHEAFASAAAVLETPRGSDGDDLENLSVAREILGIAPLAPRASDMRARASGAPEEPISGRRTKSRPAPRPGTEIGFKKGRKP